ncbi:PTS transporter subunit IIABC [[Mycoplasma] testudinis]|uniref:PTS transporter subunit IIABC n=1 Tax=[Mycoplasma] testudinis TaxID=33924 RepID=UPI0006973A8B|nr:glucose PTS transporter subunit IIA [[Mycoplasma] testudinis]
MAQQEISFKQKLVTRWKNRKRRGGGGGREFIGKLSGGIMMPIAVLPIAGLLLGIGSAILNNIPSSVDGWSGSPQAFFALFGFASFITNSGNFIFGNLAVLFAIAIAIAFTADAGVAGLAAFIAWVSFNGMQSAMIFPVAPTTGAFTFSTDFLAANATTTAAGVTTGASPNINQVISDIQRITGSSPTGSQTVAEWLKNIPVADWSKISLAAAGSGADATTAAQILRDGTFTTTPTGLSNMLYWKDLKSEVFTANTGINSLQSSVFGGALIGALVAVIYNKTYQIQMPKILGFFSGTRFVPIASLLAMMPASVIFSMIWPGIGILLGIIGVGLGTLAANGGANALIFGFIERSLVPTGLHHAFYSPLWYTAAGGSMQNAGSVVPLIREGDKVFAIMQNPQLAATSWEQVIQNLNPGYVFSSDTGSWAGDQRLWFALNRFLMGKEVLLSNGDMYRLTYQTFAQNTLNTALPAVTFTGTGNALTNEINSIVAAGNNGVAYDASKFPVAFAGVNPGQYEQGKYPFMIFGLPAASAAMVMAAPKQNRKTALSIVGSAALTSFLTGITEPIEFTFLFLAPWLFWGVHTVYAAISFWLMSLLGANVGQTFSGGIIDLGIYGFLPDGLGYHVNSFWAIVIGVPMIPIYYFTFYFAITKRNLQTPGRGGALKTKKDYLAQQANKKNQNLNVNAGFTPLQLKAYELINAYGGEDNITVVNACITKLRVSIKDQSKVDKETIKDLGAAGVMDMSPTLSHAIFGVEAEAIKTQMNAIMQNQLDKTKLKQAVEGFDQQAPAPAAPAPEKTENLPKEITILSPISGIAKPLSEVPDVVFKDKIMGDGFAFEPNQGMIKVPSDKDVKVEVAFPTGHAYIVDVDGAKVLIHIGIETVSLNNGVSDPSKLVGFKPIAKQGELASQDLTDVDFDFIRSKNLKTITPVVVLTETLAKYNLEVLVKANDVVTYKQPIYKLTLKNS